MTLSNNFDDSTNRGPGAHSRGLETRANLDAFLIQSHREDSFSVYTSRAPHVPLREHNAKDGRPDVPYSGSEHFGLISTTSYGNANDSVAREDEPGYGAVHGAGQIGGKYAYTQGSAGQQQMSTRHEATYRLGFDNRLKRARRDRWTARPGNQCHRRQHDAGYQQASFDHELMHVPHDQYSKTYMVIRPLEQQTQRPGEEGSESEFNDGYITE